MIVASGFSNAQDPYTSSPRSQYIWFPIARVLAQHIRRIHSVDNGDEFGGYSIDVTSDLAIVIKFTEAYKTLPVTREFLLMFLCCPLRNARPDDAPHDSTSELQLDKLSAYISGEDDVLATHIAPASLVGSRST